MPILNKPIYISQMSIWVKN